jgi:two-component sensor histidine kinase
MICITDHDTLDAQQALDLLPPSTVQVLLGCEFTTDDVHFLEAVANVLAGAIQRTRAEEQQALLLAELSHRVKNTLAVVQSLAVLTGERAGSFPAFLASFRGRLSALAATHGLLTETHWRGASLEQLARATLAPHVGSDRIRLELGHVKLRPAAAQTISLLFHELATNAGKHGALTAPGGQVTLSARVIEAGLELVWQEGGGPPVEEPSTRGFGTSVLFRAIEHQHDGTVEVDWRPEGLICTVTIPAPEALADHPHPAPLR